MQSSAINFTRRAGAQKRLARRWFTFGEYRLELLMVEVQEEVRPRGPARLRRRRINLK
jgi:hypothetical protein